LEEIYLKKHQYPIRVQRLLRPSHALHNKIASWLDTYKGTFAIAWAPD
jgi:hypothetical protein